MREYVDGDRPKKHRPDRKRLIRCLEAFVLCGRTIACSSGDTVIAMRGRHCNGKIVKWGDGVKSSSGVIVRRTGEKG
jgi:hypothetical protein